MSLHKAELVTDVWHYQSHEFHLLSLVISKYLQFTGRSPICD